MTGGFLTRGLEEHDWQVPAIPGQDQGDGAYDVIVIGSGMGGLSCAALLSKWGYRVLVLEHHALVGGYYSSFERSGFRFNAGAMEITGLWEGGPLDLLLKDLGLGREDYFVRNSYNYRFGSWEIEPFDRLEGLIEQLSELFPEEARGIGSFFEDAQKAHDQWFLDSWRYVSPPPPELVARLFGAERLEEDRKRRPDYYDWLGKSWGQKLDDHFKGNGVKTLLDFMLNHLRIDPYKTPAEVALRGIGFLRFGSFYPKGGAQRLSNALRDAIRVRGGKVLLGRRADEILTSAGAVTGVRASDEVFRSAVVVSNSSIKNTIVELLDPSAVGRGYLSAVEAIKMQEAYSMVFLGVDMDLSGYPTMTQVLDVDREEFILVAINSNADASYAPEGMASITLIGPADYHDYPPRGTPAYQKLKQEAASRLIELASRVIPDLTQQIIVQDAATPKTLERYTLAPEGSGEGIFWSTEVPRPWFKTPVKGLYLAGSSTYPGAGVELALMSGVICANDINGWRGQQDPSCSS
jgi:all-trans-retinol 13,14-reductase